MKYAVIMYNFNNYEIMRDLPDCALNKDIEYIYITDDVNFKSKNWKIIIDKDLEGLSPFDKCYRVRFNLFKYTDAEIVLYVDGSLQILSDPIRYFKKFEESGKDVGLMVHPWRTNMFDEYKEWVRIRNYPQSSAFKCLSYMQAHGYDVKNYKGLYQLTLRLVKKTDKNEKLDNRTFEVLSELNEGGKIERIDQTIYSYLLNTEFQNMSIYAFNDNCIHNNVMVCNPHGKIAPGFNNNRNKIGYVRNELVEVDIL